MDEDLFPPTFRLQDELHLLRDSLGAVDAHYEAALDGLQQELTNRRPKILASSATLSGYEKQVEVLYRRKARVFPQPPPREGHGFWSKDTNQLMRRFLAVAPRGVTIEFAVDRLIVALQRAVRRLLTEPEELCREVGIDPEFAPFLLDIYGTNIVYGNTLRDLDAVMRSAETQLTDIEGKIGRAQLTGRIDFAEIRRTMDRLEKPESDFLERLHLVPASSMMSHGVDINRLNVMVMLGLPLGTAEFIQATARVGRRWPAIVIVVHKIGRERDASVYRSFPQYVSHGDRFVEPIPITRRSRRVLARTISGLEFARIHHVHEPNIRNLKDAPPALTMVRYLAKWKKAAEGVLEKDKEDILDSLGLDHDDFQIVNDVDVWFREFDRNIEDPPTNATFATDASPTGAPMRSLRDVEEQVPVSGEDPS